MTSTTPRSRARRSTPAASGEASISGKRARTWRRTALSVEEAGERLDDDPAGGAVDRTHDLGDHRGQGLAAAAAHYPHLVQPGGGGLRGRAGRPPPRGLDAQADHPGGVE